MTVQDKEDLVDQISSAIKSHGMWKRRLIDAIDTGRSTWTVETVAACDQCAFGQWLENLPEASRDEHYSTVHDLHARFHSEAAEVLRLALAGDRTAAEQRINATSTYSELTMELTMASSRWLDAVQSET